MRTLVLLLFPLCITSSLHAQKGNDLFDPTYLHEVRLYFPQPDFWDVIDDIYEEHIDIDDTGTNVPYLGAKMQIDGLWLDTVGVRQKGLSSNGHSNHYKKPLKVDINEFIDDQKYDGIKKFNLHNGAMDPGMVRDFLAYNIHRTAGVKAPRVSFCKLYLNDEYWGVYGIIEQIDKTFVENHFSDGSGNLIKNKGWTELEWLGDSIQPYLEDFQMRTNEEEPDWSGFLNFVDVLNNTPDENFAEEIQKVFAVDNFLRVMATDVLTNNWDSYIDNERNFYLYEHPADGRFHWIPWDYNLSLGGTFSTSGNPYAPVDENCFARPTFTWSQADSTFTFIDKSYPLAESWHWDFGDGNSSAKEFPKHHFTNTGETRVCLTVGRNTAQGYCEQQRCKTVDLNFVPTDCPSQENGTSPYPVTDAAYQEVVRDDAYCCVAWDALCEVKYHEANATTAEEIEAVEIRHHFPLLIDNPNKILIHRLLNVPEFKQRYLDIVCNMTAHNFTRERLYPMIDKHADLLRQAIYEEPNYIFTMDYFEYDLGDGTGGGGGARIPAVKTVLEQRFKAAEEDLAELRQDCSMAANSLQWHDVVINELMASNDEDSGIADAAGEYDDWIEIYNNTTETINLQGFFLSDDEEDLHKWAFPNGTQIAANDYLIIWADKDEEQAGLHTNFKLSKSGESLFLTHEDGTAVDAMQYTEQETNIALARMPNGIGDFTLQSATIGQNNDRINNTVEQLSSTAFQIFPNPASDFFYLENNLEGYKNTYQIQIYNAVGQLVLQQKGSLAQRQKIETTHLATGLFFIKVQTNNGLWQDRLTRY